MEQEEGTVRGIKCLLDGYPSHTGYILSKYYNNKERVSKLISYGDIIHIDRRIFAERDLPEKHSILTPHDDTTIRYADAFNKLNTAPFIVPIDSLREVQDAEYIYVFSEQLSWKCYGNSMNKYLGLAKEAAQNNNDKYIRYKQMTVDNISESNEDFCL